MSKNTKVLSKELINILSKASANKIYGSVEVYFEAGNVTQITQRIINKVSSTRKTSAQNTSPYRINSKHKMKSDAMEISPVSRSF